MANLSKGLYEQLISQALAEAIRLLDRDGLTAARQPLDPADSHELLTRHVAGVLRRVLRGVPEKNRIEQQVIICNDLLQLLREKHAETAPAGEAVTSPAEALLAVLQARATPDGGTEVLLRPHVPLSASDLLVNARGEPGVGHALDREIPSADRIDLLCAFVRWNGLRLLLPRLRTHCAHGRPLRVITTTYTGTTRARRARGDGRAGARVVRNAVHAPAREGVAVPARHRVLHGLHRVVEPDAVGARGRPRVERAAVASDLARHPREVPGDVRQLLGGTRFRAVRPRARRAAVRPRRVGDSTTDPLQLPAIDVIPFPHQREILERLAVEREPHHRFRTLVVAATGTGKTIVAALDYRRLREEFGDLRLLFVAHRKELLSQSLGEFRQVLRDGSFGELYVDGYRPKEWRHVFASVQSLAQLDLADLKPDAFDVVIVDEFHHAAAPTYKRLLDHVRPKYLVGLTATPERADGERAGVVRRAIAIELRLWEALERGLLCPFHYFGLHDNTDLSSLTWSRRGYDVRELENLYTANHARVGLVGRAIAEKVADPRRMRALGFCVSIAHAEFMAREFNRMGLPSLAVSSESGRDERDAALRRLRLREVNAVFAVDLFNEGIDVPEIDTVLFLRPTESATVFLQQLGRGLRQYDHKSCLTVLDFIGNANRRFRFDQRYRALTDTTRAGVIKQIEEGFPFLPAGCTIQLDRVSTDLVLENLRESIGANVKTFVRELQQIGRDVGLAEFLREAGVSLEELYRNAGWTWTRIRREANLPTSPFGPREGHLSRALGRLLHQDDPVRLAFLQEFLSQPPPPPTASLNESQRRILLGLHFTLWGNQDEWPSIDDSMASLWQHPAIMSELRELLSVLEDEATHLSCKARGRKPEARGPSVASEANLRPRRTRWSRPSQLFTTNSRECQGVSRRARVARSG